MSILGESIYKTLAFFDAEDLPLTLMELKGYLFVGPISASLSELETSLQTELPGKVEYQDGFYFLAGRSELVARRKARYTTSLVRFRKAKKILRIMCYIPYLRAVAISGSQALLNSSESSDIDLFVITKKNRIWLARFLVSLIFQILGQRRHGEHIENRFCLNHYVNEDTVILEDRNVYTAVEYASLIPVLGHESLKEFWMKNTWITEFLREPVLEQGNHFFKSTFSPAQKVFEFVLNVSVGPLLNKLAGIYQKKRIHREEHILVSDSELSFHPGSRGQRVLQRFQKNLAAAKA